MDTYILNKLTTIIKHRMEFDMGVFLAHFDYLILVITFWLILREKSHVMEVKVHALCLRNILNDRNRTLWLDPSSILVSNHALVLLLPPVWRNEVVILQEITSLVHQCYVPSRREHKSLPFPMVSAHHPKPRLHSQPSPKE